MILLCFKAFLIFLTNFPNIKIKLKFFLPPADTGMEASKKHLWDSSKRKGKLSLFAIFNSKNIVKWLKVNFRLQYMKKIYMKSLPSDMSWYNVASHNSSDYTKMLYITEISKIPMWIVLKSLTTIFCVLSFIDSHNFTLL